MRTDNRYTSRQRRETPGLSHRQPTRREAPIARALLLDFIAAALFLLVFYLTNYVMAPDIEGIPLPAVSASPVASASLAQPSTAPSGDDTASAPPAGADQQSAPAESASPGQPATLREKFADKFTTGAVEKTDTSYKSANVNVTVNKVQENGVTYFLTDIYVADIKYFKTAFGSTDKLGTREFVADTLKANVGIVGINGDNSLDNPCLLIRNGVYYPKFTNTTADALVMYDDGTMKTIPNGQLDMKKVKAESPYQVWGFGPMLLDNGKPMTKFNSPFHNADQRTAIGYYEPGHYCFLVVDGRRPDYSNGYSMADMSNLFYKLGCKVAFNLDGGGTSQMAFLGTTTNSPCSDYRKTYDCIYISDN